MHYLKDNLISLRFSTDSSHLKMRSAQMISENKTVWDIFIRVFHWTLVIAFVIGYLTEGEVYLHFYVGWYIGILLLLRFIWGFIGTTHARFSDFIKSPTEIFEYVTSLRKTTGTNKRYIGHNPLGGLMVITLLLSLSITCISGVLLYTEDGKAALSFIGHSPIESFEEDHSNEKTSSNMVSSVGKYAEYDDEKDDDEDEVIKEIHEFFANFTVFLILLHIAGVIVSSRLNKENLVLAMITGKKSVEKK